MAARGTESKTVVFNKLMEVFPDSFWEDEGKILRIPQIENGNKIEIKVTLTAAKNLLGDAEIPNAFDGAAAGSSVSTEVPAQMTEEEKENVSKMLESLGL